VKDGVPNVEVITEEVDRRRRRRREQRKTRHGAADPRQEYEGAQVRTNPSTTPPPLYPNRRGIAERHREVLRIAIDARRCIH
jgi:hypothetical protein